MAINIKELFVTDLDPNSNFWWSRDKVDKINYNFDLLSNGGMPGPQGTIGVDGGFGPAGTQGNNGFKGTQGFQGPQGEESLNDWVLFPEVGGLPGYLYPRKNLPNDVQVVPVALRIGYINNPTDPDYDTGAEALNSPAQIVKTQPTVNEPNWVNLRVEDNNNINGYNFSLKSAGGNPRFEISPDIGGPSAANFKIIWIAKTTVFSTGSTAASMVDSIKITDSQITINTGNIIPPAFTLSNDAIVGSNNITKSENQFRFTPNATTDKVLVATDALGNVEWKDVKEVFGTFPIGSIISIRPSDFVTDNFWLDDAVSTTLGYPLNNIYGRGKLGTDYEGWYLCNGETWETPSGFNGTLTPNLNNFTYTIDANNDVQYAVTSQDADLTPIILGGYDMQITATCNAAGVYTVSYVNTFPNNDTSPGTSTITMGGTGSHYTSRMIHIVYLGLTNLKWTNSGDNIIVPPPPVNDTIFLGRSASQLPAAICATQPDTYYSWTGPNNAEWNTFNIVGSTYQLFNLGTQTFAQTGWYINPDGYPLRWTVNNALGTASFTARGILCQPTLTDENLRYSLLVDDLNGPLSSFGGTDIYLDFGLGTFATATSLVWGDNGPGGIAGVGTPADAGWYREISTGVRRYWSGAAFEGVSFTQDWVNRVYSSGYDFNPGYNNATGGSSQTVTDMDGNTTTSYSTICEQLQAEHLTYVAGDKILAVPNSPTTQVQNVKDYQNNTGIYTNAPGNNGISNGTCLYVPVGWAYPIDMLTGEPLSTPPLINIALQNKPPLPGSTKYTKFYTGDAKYGTILTTGTASQLGKIGSVLTCI